MFIRLTYFYSEHEFVLNMNHVVSLEKIDNKTQLCMADGTKVAVKEKLDYIYEMVR